MKNRWNLSMEITFPTWWMLFTVWKIRIRWKYNSFQFSFKGAIETHTFYIFYPSHRIWLVCLPKLPSKFSYYLTYSEFLLVPPWFWSAHLILSCIVHTSHFDEGILFRRFHSPSQIESENDWKKTISFAFLMSSIRLCSDHMLRYHQCESKLNRMEICFESSIAQMWCDGHSDRWNGKNRYSKWIEWMTNRLNFIEGCVNLQCGIIDIQKEREKMSHGNRLIIALFHGRLRKLNNGDYIKGIAFFLSINRTFRYLRKSQLGLEFFTR